MIREMFHRSERKLRIQLLIEKYMDETGKTLEEMDEESSLSVPVYKDAYIFNMPPMSLRWYLHIEKNTMEYINPHLAKLHSTNKTANGDNFS